MQTSIDLETPAVRIARLEANLRAAEERALIAEAQLRRVHEAVRAFKEKQLKARAAQLQAQSRAATSTPTAVKPENNATGLYGSWAVSDPSLDKRFDEYLDSEFEPDRSRDWMLGQ